MVRTRGFCSVHPGACLRPQNVAPSPLGWGGRRGCAPGAVPWAGGFSPPCSPRAGGMGLCFGHPTASPSPGTSCDGCWGCATPQEMLVTELPVGCELGLEARRCWGLRSGPPQPHPAPTPAPGAGEGPWVVLAGLGGLCFSLFHPHQTLCRRSCRGWGATFTECFSQAVSGETRDGAGTSGGASGTFFGCCFPFPG